MTRIDKNLACLGTDFETTVLIHLFMVSTLVNGAISDHPHCCSHEIQISSEKRPENLGETYQVKVDHHFNSTKIIPSGNVLLSTSFEKILHWIFDNEIEKGGRSCAERRRLKFKFGERFAFRKRLQFALLPIMYKMGVMTTLLTGLTVLALKGLTIGVILLIFTFGNYFTKLQKHSNQPAQPIHVHVHSQDGHKVTSFPSAVGPWDRVTDEIHPSAILEDENLKSYRQRLIQNSAALLKFKPLLQ